MSILTCPEHGEYDASLGACPVCSGSQRPAAPPPLSEDDMPTDLVGGGSYYFAGSSGGDDIDPTEFGAGASGEDATELGSGGEGLETVFDFVDDSMVAILWVKEGDRRGRIHQVKDGCVVGRENPDVDVDLADQKVSRTHAKFTLGDDGFSLWDFGTRNGTFVNGERISAATPLKENDLIKIGDTVFVLKLLD